MFGLFAKKPVLDEPSVAWIFDSFAWALRNLDADVFFNETVLVQPSGRFFPGRGDSPHEIAKLVFDKVREYSGMAHWPFYLPDPGAARPAFQPKITLEGPLRGSDGLPVASGSEKVALLYDPSMVTNPQALIASFAHLLAQYLGSMANEAPPGGKENWAYLTEIVAIFMGFGLIFANNAYEMKGSSCGSGSCGSHVTDRAANLGQYDLTYALALFCVLKQLPTKGVSKLVKSSLRSYFKQAVNDVESRSTALNTLRNITTNNQLKMS